MMGKDISHCVGQDMCYSIGKDLGHLKLDGKGHLLDKNGHPIPETWRDQDVDYRLGEDF